ncbi:MAG TPA: hypothetical protein VD793_05695 [Gemmatimonadales bacterium]|nr:hypothetical protein [Gemmatimonadales bacterium]
MAARLSRSFVAVPDTVGPGDSVRVVLNLVNPTAQAVSFTGLYSCPAFIVVVRDAAEVELQGSKFACPAALTQFRIPAQDSLTVTYEMIARVRAVGSADSFTLAPPGVYRLRADLNMSLPDMEASITVVPSALR